MLKMFASQGSATKEVSAQQLRNFLDKKVKEHLLIVSGGYYKLAK
jgi:anaphase-promoting complex subunit 2